jgi:phosphocarrier protein
VSTVAEKAIQLKNKYGLHARPATEFVKVASEFKAEILVEKDGQEVNGKSIFGLMMLAAEMGSTLRIRAVGDDADRAVTALETLIDGKFNEE